MSTYGYTRVSTSEQADDRSSLADQERRIRGAALMRGADIRKVFCDPGVSGGLPISKRPSGAEMMATIRTGDTIVAAKMDRIFRSAEDALVTAARLQEMGVKLIIADMGPDPVTENGAAKLFFTMLAAFAEFERNRIAERVRDGRTAKAARGGSIGGIAPYGKRVSGSGRNAVLVDDPEEARTVAKARLLRQQGLSLRGISAALAAAGTVSRAGSPFAPAQISRMLDE